MPRSLAEERAPIDSFFDSDWFLAISLLLAIMFVIGLVCRP